MSKFLILDGGMSRELLRLGAELKQPEWSALALINSPEIVRQVHDEFIAAGSDVITTNSYALVPFHIGEERFRADGAALIARAGQLARDAADACKDRKILVAGSLPPIFGSYEPENFDPSRVQDYLKVLVENLDPYVDVWLGETLSLIAEGEAVRTAVAETGKPFWISFTLADDAAQRNGASPALRSGERVEDAARWAASSGAEALLFNCSKPEVMRAAVDTAGEVFRSSGSTLQIGVYANAFEGEQGESAANEGLHATRDDLNDDAYSRFACSWVDAGATMVGGCCGIGAGHIHQLRRSLTHAVEAAGNS
ncbi:MULTISPECIES: homocysteine S-methyltransferase family protein [unclassified Rhizobium]|uniref:homocysteine S-methyltransferase family protein n=1 Tax=unclassified Rhizobium TaxID=2613769 RepID=UPI00160D6E59|nr:MULTISPECIES: homocysteine S-methyltransferase family protein [unclassified Rhizobium]MBB3289533.1 S-methylmethionine-dependent homocysteine/selenocysteine methylase [Rhizobium sp. BK252]MBB3404475.1 S-methylmethionine-dependent homocysteine/selenocysteine methylase [Rhizobium sp. BK289]MBB3416861.1 S-methylmethionine-dependent homocysteine/selenocysteine methylase [Rhizobium sp. BK284]MBB3484738.1 S-methylmethionine-dependent homocysteine/selenocysteine methylase [Rhizobium sp. BK347]